MRDKKEQNQGTLTVYLYASGETKHSTLPNILKGKENQIGLVCSQR